jgi:DNA-binding XRE family transcriptional regulator
LLEGRDRWECKIGYSSKDVIQRISSQVVQSVMAYDPTIGLIIHCSNGYYVESKLHKSLYQYRLNRKSSLVGDEWFMTSPNEIENIYLHDISPPTSYNTEYIEYTVDDIKRFGEILNCHRKQLNITQEHLGKVVNTGRKTIHRLMNSDMTIGLSTFFKTLETLKLKMVLVSDIKKDIGN